MPDNVWTSANRTTALAETGPVWTKGSLTVWYDDQPVSSDDKHFESVMFQQQADAQRLAETVQLGHNIAEGMDAALHLVPGSSVMLDLPEAISGRKISTGEQLSDGDRLLAASPILLPILRGLKAVRIPGSLVEQLALHADVQRALLRDAMGAAGTGKIAHHLIPLEAISANRSLLEKAANGGFNLNGKENGILLDAINHVENHPVYNRDVLDILRTIPKDLTPEATAGEVRKIADLLNKAIKKGTYGPWG